MAEHKQAVVVGALGVIGRYIVARLLEEGDWSVVGLSRRTAEPAPRYRHIAVDLLDAEATAEKLAGLRDATHVFYAAFQPAAGAAAGYAENIAPNRAMLVNAVTAIARAAPRLRRVVLVTGTKYYGSHLGPYRTPARESDPRHAGAELLFRPDRLARRLPARQRLGRRGAAAADAVRLCAGHADEPGAGHRGLRRDQQGAWAAAAFSGQARRFCRDLSGHRVGALRQGRAVGGERAALRPARPSTSPTAIISAGKTCGRSSPPRSTWPKARSAPRI